MANAINQATSTRPSITPSFPSSASADRVMQFSGTTDLTPENVRLLVGTATTTPPVDEDDLTNKIEADLVSATQANYRSLSGGGFSWNLQLVGITAVANGSTVWAILVDASASSPRPALAAVGPFPVNT